jgi:hypothetical protein
LKSYVGYGDLAPKQPASKIFTMIYILVGIGILLGFVEKVARNAQIIGGAKKNDSDQSSR